jgi:ATP-dependent Clp protease adaptor protein ClpS
MKICIFTIGIYEILIYKDKLMSFDLLNSTLATPLLDEKTELDECLATPWKVIVLNDPVNLMNYVVMVFKKVFGYNDTKATKHMMEVHEQGKSVLWVGEREQAENYAYQLQRWRLQTILEKDD